ncbi:MAG: hypothetical protein H0T84_13515 [Tatlockia sp.]|nr:hypothetical protein [Tatlockia sp.]
MKRKTIVSKQAGLVLLTTIMVIGLLALLTLSQLQILLLDFKAISMASKKKQDFWTLETAANTVLRNIALEGQESCLLSEKDPDVVINLLKNKKGCPLIHEKQPFYYLIEDLGVFPCLQVLIDNKIYSTRHFRLSIHSAEKHAAILQLRHARIEKLVICDNNEPKQSKLGLQSWRYLSG